MDAVFYDKLVGLEQEMRDICVQNHEIADEIRVAWKGRDATEYLNRFFMVNECVAETASQLRAVSQSLT